MWRSLWRSIDRFSLQYFKYIINELQQIKVVDMHNRELVIDLLQSIVELVTYGDRQDPLIFECFMEYQVLAEFVRVLKISKNSRIEAPLLQYLSIMIQNMNSEHSIYYCLSNDYINSIIGHEFDFEGGDLALYYVSFLRAVSNKINKDTLCLLLKVHGDTVVSFPLYHEALKFSHHREKMIQTAIRALTLSIYNVSDDTVYQYITAPPVSKYFSDLAASLREQFLHLDSLVQATNGMLTYQKREELLLETDEIIDNLYYLKDILDVGDSRLSRVVIENLLRTLVFPTLPILQLRKINVSNLSVVTSFYTVSRLLQVIGGKGMFDSVAGVILHPYMASSVRDSVARDSIESIDDAKSILNQLSDLEKVASSDPEPEGVEKIGCPRDTLPIHRSGILAHIFSESYSLLLSSLFVLFILAEAKDLHTLLFQMIGLSGMRDMLAADGNTGNIFVIYRDQIVNALLKASYQQSREYLQKELDGCWFDHIPEVLRNEWAGCKAALEESSQCKDPFFLLELKFSQQNTDGDATSYLAWQKMVDTVKVFILHLQLKSCIIKGKLLEDPMLNISTVEADSGRTHASDVASASFGSEVPLGSGIPCRIAFSNAGIRDIYLIPVARKTSGKLLLAEKHPFRSHRGTVLAIAPLAGSNPKVDVDHPTWLHLQIREFEPKFRNTKFRGYHAVKSHHIVDGRWTLGFSDAKACAAARLTVVEETRKLGSSVANLLAPLLENNYLGNLSESEDD